ncbi:hypothetical protein AAG570_010490 [Ranatra chinensis]|uniref:peptidylprolyl isomerase n=1 Tax=Ranatra chinensis TaxID=642074 RepID=A0ABD0YMY3_9HEMI
MNKVRPRVFFDVEVGGLALGRIVFQLYSDICPATCENFRSLCTGEKGLGKTTGKPLHYKATIFHRVVKDFMIQGGDFSVGNGTGGESIYGGTFEDENLETKHDRPFLLSMANRGKNTNGSQFFVTTQPAPHLDGVHVVFGEVVSGQAVVSHVEGLPVDRMSRPLQDAKITNCGELVLRTKTKQKPKKVSSSEERSDSESDSEVEKKKKKKKKEKKEKKKRSKYVWSESSESDDDSEDEDELHPLANVTKINPEEIPEDPKSKKEKDEKKDKNKLKGKDEQKKRDRRDQRWQPFRGYTRSGKKIKGRGILRYRTPSRSRSRSYTPPHWRQEQRRTISLTEYLKKEEERKKREEARKKRHEEKDPDGAKRKEKTSKGEKNVEPEKEIHKSVIKKASEHSGSRTVKEPLHRSGKRDRTRSREKHSRDRKLKDDHKKDSSSSRYRRRSRSRRRTSRSRSKDYGRKEGDRSRDKRQRSRSRDRSRKDMKRRDVSSRDAKKRSGSSSDTDKGKDKLKDRGHLKEVSGGDQQAKKLLEQFKMLQKARDARVSKRASSSDSRSSSSSRSSIDRSKRRRR